MNMAAGNRVSAASRGFTLVELLAALLILSLLGLMSYRGLGAVLDARASVDDETAKWRSVAAFFARFKHDIQLAAPRPVRVGFGTAPAWHGRPGATPLLEFSRFAADENLDTMQRIGYRLNENREIELWLWPGLDVAPSAAPVRHVVLAGINTFEVHYLDAHLIWTDTWPAAGSAAAIPRAMRLRLELASGENIVRVFMLQP